MDATGHAARFEAAGHVHMQASPDGKRLAFISGRDGVDAMYVVDADGTRLQKLTDGETLNPAWSR